METIQNRSSPSLVLDLMFAALRVRNEPLNDIATELFGRYGDSLIHRLVLEAARRKNPPAYRLRLLEVIRRIRPAPDMVWYFDLFMLTSDKNPAIRFAAGRVIVEIRPSAPVPFAGAPTPDSDGLSARAHPTAPPGS